METVVLQFSTREQLLDFCAPINNISCTVDLEKFTLSSHSEDVIELAMNKYGVSIFAENSATRH